NREETQCRATDEGVHAHDTDSERNSDGQRSWGCRDHATRRLDHSEIRYDTVERSTRYVACGVPHSLSVEESALYRQQLGKQRADDGKNHDANKQLDEREAAPSAANLRVSHWVTPGGNRCRAPSTCVPWFARKSPCPPCISGSRAR